MNVPRYVTGQMAPGKTERARPGLLKPALEMMWVDDVRQMNKFLDTKVPDVEGHLFGRDRIALTPVRTAFKEFTAARTCLPTTPSTM